MAGRPINSKTPAWRSQPAIKVVAYRFLMRYKKTKATKAGCARYMHLSRTTVIKWWDLIEWSKDDINHLVKVRNVWDYSKTDKNNVKRIATCWKMEVWYVWMMSKTLDLLYEGEYIKDLRLW